MKTASIYLTIFIVLHLVVLNRGKLFSSINDYPKCEHVFVNTTHQDTATIFVEREFTGMDDWKMYEVMKADKPCICLFCHERGKCY